jgi:hypothetical protein
MVARIFLVLLLSGCGHFTKMENVYIDNSATNNFVGNPCGFYLNDRCLYIKPTARNLHNPYNDK